MKTTVSGGVLPDFETEEFKRWLNKVDEREERQRKQAAEAAEREAELDALYDHIEATFTPYLHKEAAAVNSASRIKPADKTIFEQFKTYCARWSPPLSPLPAHPAAVAAFLTSELTRGASLFMKRLNAISRVHQAVSLPDPTRDVLCAALVRLVKNQKEGN